MRALQGALVAACLLSGAAAGFAEEPLPPAPGAYFNDYAGVVSAADAERLDQKLRQFAKETSTQVVVAVFDRLPSQSLEDFTVKTAESWRVGRKDWDNGAVFFVFVKDRKLRIETGYGLEGALPDALARRILDGRVVPRLRAGDYAGGLEAGIDGILAATRGEYKAPPPKQERVPLLAIVIVLAFVVLLLWLASQGVRQMPVGRTYDRRGPRRDGSHWSGGSWGGWGGGGGFSGGSGGGSFGGGGFSGGGGSFGGGGASSSW